MNDVVNSPPILYQLNHHCCDYSNRYTAQCRCCHYTKYYYHIVVAVVGAVENAAAVNDDVVVVVVVVVAAVVFVSFVSANMQC